MSETTKTSENGFTDEEIILKIQKLLRLAERAGTPEEAAAAAAKAQELQESYRISALALEEETGTKETIGKGELHAESVRSAWRDSLGSALARANGCKTYQQRHGRIGYGGRTFQMLIGRPSDQQAVRELYFSLVMAIEALSARECKGLGFVYANNFRLGCAEAVRVKLEEAKRAREVQRTATGQTNAIVLVRKADEEVAAWEKANMHYRASARSHVSFSAVARAHGVRAGSSLSVTRTAKLGSSKLLGGVK